MSRVNAGGRNIGLYYNGNSTKARVWAPFASTVDIELGDGRAIALQKEALGYWSAAIDAGPGARYKFILDGKEAMPDPASLYQPEGVHGYSEIINLDAHEWGGKEWKNPPLEDYIFYELHTGTFTNEGTFAAIADKIPHLLELGVTAIEIMPVGQFPGNRNWGYDGVFPFAAQDSYGGPGGLQQLVSKCHENGLAVVLDVVYNHMGPEGNYLPQYGPYFTDKYKTPWGDAVNYDDAWCDGVRDFVIENVLMWFRDFHIDALRFDAVHAIKDLSAKHILKEIREYTDVLQQQTGKTYHLIVECDLNDSRYIDTSEKNGLGMDAQWNDEFHHALRVCAGNDKKGYYADFDGVGHLAKSYCDAYVYDGVYSAFRQKTFGSKAVGHPGRQFAVFSQNHDQVGNRMLGERTSSLVSFEMLKLLAGAVLASPFLPLLFMGEEWGAPQPFQYFISHEDEKLADAVRKGRKEEFAHFHNDSDNCPDPQSEATFERCKLGWALAGTGRHAVLLAYYKALIALRKATPALRILNRENVTAYPIQQKQVLVLHRWHGQQNTCCVLNFSGMQQQIEAAFMPSSTEIIFSSADTQWMGPGYTHQPGTQNITITPESINIYTFRHV